MNRMLGRTLNTNTMMWEFRDGSGVSIPNEVMPHGPRITMLDLFACLIWRDKRAKEMKDAKP